MKAAAAEGMAVLHRHAPPPSLLAATCRLFPQPWPREVLVAWGLAVTVFGVVFGTWSYRYYVSSGVAAGGGRRAITTRQKTR